MDMKSKVKRIGLIIKHRHDEAASLAITIAQLLLKKDIQVFFCDESVNVLKHTPVEFVSRVKVVKKSTIADRVNFIIVLGGDGTFLSAARLMKAKTIPILGINMGTLGFLTEVRKEEVKETLSAILKKGTLPISERVMSEVKVIRKGKVILRDLVVNDAVVSKGAIPRIIGVKINVNRRYANTIRADGVIVSTPTGSTAYSLAAGGPIVMPTVDCMLITPICAHGLSQRTIMIPDDGEIELEMDHMPGHAYITVDGQEGIDLNKGDLIRVSRFNKHKLKVVTSPKRDYFSLLREKFNFGNN